jgi:4'-phosphopantetheinyl transferase EntD
VARGTQVQALGIDVEDIQTLSDGVVRAITRSNEVMPGTYLDERAWHLLRFSAKEAVFKAWFSERHLWLDFQDVTVTFEPPPGAVTIGTFLATVRPLAEPTGVTYAGRYGMHRSGYVATVAVADTCQLWAPRGRCR